ncbi:MAG: YlbF family regulator [Chloroflexi bacterium]|nr:YlbF family regulator [Chloroflexota bacterium]
MQARQTTNMAWSEVEAEGSRNEALQAARQFAAVLAESPQYRAMEEAERRLRQDAAAQAAIRAFQEKQRTLGWQAQVGLLGEAERAELTRLQGAMLVQPAVRAYTQAQEEMALVCQTVSQEITQAIGLNFAAACGPGCC